MGLEKVTRSVCALALGLGGNAWAAPNYIVIVADDFGSDKMRPPFSWNGTGTPPNNFPTTTNLTTLGNAGLRFTNAWANPVCSSSRVSLNTGNYAWRDNIGTQLEPGATNQLGDVETLAGVLHDTYGYETALFGKWHLGEKGSPVSSIWTVADTSPGALGTVFPAPMKRVDGLNPGYGYFDGFLEGVVDFDSDDDWDHIYLDGADNWQLESTAMDGADYADEVMVDAAAAWIADAVADPEGDPWLAVVTLSAPHAMKTSTYVESDVMNDTECDKISDTSKSYYVCLHDTGGTPILDDCTEAAIYQALVECMDERIGEFLTAVARVGARDQTIVVFMGDNGTPDTVMKSPYSDPADTTDFIHDVGKGTVYQSGVRVPFIMASFDAYAGRTPDFITAAGLNVPALVQSWDLYATMIDAAAGTAGTDGSETDSISLYDCFDATTSSDAATCAGTGRFHYAEIFDVDSATGDLVRGVASVGVKLSGSEWSMIATYNATDECMETELFRLKGGTTPDPQQTDPLTAGDVGYTTAICNQARAKFKTVDPDGDGWMPRTTGPAGNIKWCVLCP